MKENVIELFQFFESLSEYKSIYTVPYSKIYRSNGVYYNVKGQLARSKSDAFR
jgi:hypothetical protein